MWNQSQISISRFKVHIWPWINATRNLDSHFQSWLNHGRLSKTWFICCQDGRWKRPLTKRSAISDSHFHILCWKRIARPQSLSCTSQGLLQSGQKTLMFKWYAPPSSPHLLFPCFSWILLQLRIQLFQSHMMATMQWLKSYWSLDLKIVVNFNRFHF